MSQISNAVERRSTIDLVPQYRTEFSEVLPDHVKAATFVRLAQAALRKNKQLLAAADADPGSLIFALREAARLGHEPGTDNFYLVPMGGKVEGWEGYKGVVERMYRAGAVSSVIAEVVCSNDSFTYQPGLHDRPQHIVDWFGERGDIIGAYAYAVMKDGAVSKVIVINKQDIADTKRMSRGSDKPTSPWVVWPKPMILKTALHRLEPYVPTSSEYIREQLRAVADVAAEHRDRTVRTPDAGPVNADTGEVIDGELIAEAATDQGDDTEVLWPEVADVPQ